MNVLPRVFLALVICSSVSATTTTEAPRTFRAEVCFFKKNFLSCKIIRNMRFRQFPANNFLDLCRIRLRVRPLRGRGAARGADAGNWFGLVWF